MPVQEPQVIENTVPILCVRDIKTSVKYYHRSWASKRRTGATPLPRSAATAMASTYARARRGAPEHGRG